VIEVPIVIAEVAMTILSAAAEISAVVLVASIAAWRYALSPNYRMNVNAKLEQRGAVYRNAVKITGGVFVALSIPAFAFIVWVIWQSAKGLGK